MHTRYLMVPGIGGSDADHWQTLWESELGAGADRIQPNSWDEPDEADWIAALADKATPDAIIVAHSLGALAVTTFLTRAASQPVAGAFLVAPPDSTASSFPVQAASFRTAREPLPVPAVVIASSDDPYCASLVAVELAAAWRTPLVNAGSLGHINSASHLGRWDDGRQMLDRFAASLV